MLTLFVMVFLSLQDLYVDRLVERVDRLKEDIAMFEAQISAQAEETKVARDALMEANMEIEVFFSLSIHYLLVNNECYCMSVQS